MSGDQPAAQPAGDANAAAPAALAPYAFLGGIGGGGGIMGSGAFGPIAGGFPGFAPPVGTDVGTGPKARAGEIVPGAGPIAGNVFDGPANIAGGAATAIPGVGDREVPIGTSSDKATKGGTTADASDKPSMAKLTFDAKNANEAAIVVNDKGEVSVKTDKIKNGDTQIKGYMDPKFAQSLTSAQMEKVINDANAQLSAKGIKVQVDKPTDQTALARAAQDAKAQVAKAKAEAPGVPNVPKAQPPGGGGGGGGGKPPSEKPDAPNAPKHTPRDHTINKKTTGGDLQRMSAQVSDMHKAADGSEYKGMHPKSYENFTREIFSRTPSYNAVGGLGSILSTIDAEEAADDPNSPGYAERQKARAAKRASETAKFQKEHGNEIKDALADFRNESKQAGLNDSDGFDSIAKSLADPNKANDIAGLLSKKPIPGETLGQMSDRVAKVYDIQSQIAMQNVALVESKDEHGQAIDWKPSTKDQAKLKEIAKLQAAAAAAIEYRPFSFSRPKGS